MKHLFLLLLIVAFSFVSVSCQSNRSSRSYSARTYGPEPYMSGWKVDRGSSRTSIAYER